MSSSSDKPAITLGSLVVCTNGPGTINAVSERYRNGVMLVFDTRVYDTVVGIHCYHLATKQSVEIADCYLRLANETDLKAYVFDSQRNAIIDRLLLHAAKHQLTNAYAAHYTAHHKIDECEELNKQVVASISEQLQSIETALAVPPLTPETARIPSWLAMYIKDIKEQVNSDERHD